MGDRNVGDQNMGDRNVGDRNVGDQNVGEIEAGTAGRPLTADLLVSTGSWGEAATRSVFFGICLYVLFFICLFFIALVFV